MRVPLIVGALVLSVLPACGGAPEGSLFPSLRPNASAVDSSITPTERPRGLARIFKPRDRTPESTSPYGAICGDPAIRGEVIDPIPGRIPGCGVPDAVRVYEVAGVALSTPASVNCRTASALNTWVRDAVIPTVGRRGGGVASLRVAAHYACRTRNHQPGAKISEHGKGNAIDISAINLADGSALTVEGGWRDVDQGPILKRLHRQACGPFGTVLGPESDRFHQNHFHLDVARHRGGPYCR
ncbi:MAG: extensin family protein [Pseudomonadota bacterium]